MSAPFTRASCNSRAAGRAASRWCGFATAIAAALLSACALSSTASAQATAAGAGVFKIAEGGFSLEAPQGWKQVPPKSRIVEAEFQIPGAGEADAGRMTVMGAGGSLEANIDRWYGQFAQPDGSSTKEHATTKKIKIAGCDVTIVDVSGTYKDMPGGPFAGGQTVSRPGYRMLAAIVQTEGGNYFLKFYGPAATVAKHSDGFMKMLEGMVPVAR